MSQPIYNFEKPPPVQCWIAVSILLWCDVWIGLATLNGLGAGDKNICNNLHISTHDLKQLVSQH